MGCTIAHSVSVRSLGLRKPLRSATRRCSGFHIGRSPENQAPNKESHPIHQTQELPGSALMRLPTHQARTKKIAAFGDGAWSNVHFPKVPPQGCARRGTRSAECLGAARPGGNERRTSSFYLSSFAMRWTVPVPIPSDLATFKIPTPFASCFRTLRSVVLSTFGRPSFTP